MKQLLVLIVFFGLSSTVFSQNTNLNDYSYIIVPTRFDFLHEEDQFQINSMTKFFLAKNGFNAMFNTEVPDNVRRCDGLWADVIKSSGMVYTKLEVVIKDCKGNELYRSHEGKSKYKHYQKAYQDALRKAFMSFQSLNVNQPEMIVYQEDEIINKPVVDELGTGEAIDNAVNEVVVVSGTKSIQGNLPKNSYTTYSHNGSFFLLKKNQKGYAFYEESKKGDLILIGNFSLNDTVLIYREINGDSFDVAIDGMGNISIYIDGKPVVYRQLDQ